MKKILHGLMIAMLISSCASHKHVNTSVQLHYVEPLKQEIHFRFDRDDILPKYMPVLDKGLTYLKQNPAAIIIVEGYTDVIGTDQYNMDLGDKRARSLKAYFVQNGVDSNRVVIVSYGKRQQIYSKTSLNRRVILRDSSTNLTGQIKDKKL